ncbi:hypothetical protein GCM10027299_29210 [Larkinella ripae]
MAGLGACRNAPETTDITLRWSNERATGLLIPKSRTGTFPTDSLPRLLEIRRVDDSSKTAILGTYRPLTDAILFEPLIPFTRGLSYEVWLRGEPLGGFSVPVADSRQTPELLAIFPSSDSLPDNLLKIYLRFSRPMREGQSLRYVALLKNGTDTVQGAFLDLQPELWNSDRRVLTLWLDPGRIKRDLQPNKRLGAPLQSGSRYQLVVSEKWPDQQGAVLPKTYTKVFVTVPRDSLSPSPGRWQIKPPRPNGAQALEVVLNEPLDAGLLAETLHIRDEAGKPVAGSWQLADKEKTARFKPAQRWKPGRYVLRIEARLEDLAGNNLNRPFDRDVTQKTATVTTDRFFERSFRIAP